MKQFQVLIFVFLVVFNVSIARVYDEKSDAIREIEKKFKESKDLQTSILTQIKNEFTNTNSATGENDSFKYLTNRVNNTKSQFEEDANAVIRTAIVKSKPVSVIYCIRVSSDKVRLQLSALENSFKTNITAIKANKIRKINFDEYAVNAIIMGLQELKAQSIEKINKEVGPIVQLKKEAISRCESALMLLGEIEVSVTEPSLSKEYIKIKQLIERTFKTSAAQWKATLEECLEAKMIAGTDIVTF